MRQTNKFGVRVDAAGKAERTRDGHVFASLKEARRYDELLLMQRAKVIRGLEIQPAFECWTSAGRGSADRPVGVYKADFAYDLSYTVNGEVKWRGVVEDVKGFRTPLYRWKKRHVEAQYGITVVEV